jgi:uncharacterized repeat protein (TIGR03803 family)
VIGIPLRSGERTYRKFSSVIPLFEISLSAGGVWTEHVLHSFGNGTDEIWPQAGLVFDAVANLYGTTSLGGTFGWGTVFEMTPAAGGTWTEQVLHSFSGNPDGATLHARLIIDGAGNLYSTTAGGGTYYEGTVFELTPTAGGIWTEQVLHTFGPGPDGRNRWTVPVRRDVLQGL